MPDGHQDPPAGEVDRDPPGEPDGVSALPGADPRRGDSGEAGRHHPGDQVARDRERRRLSRRPHQRAVPGRGHVAARALHDEGFPRGHRRGDDQQVPVRRLPGLRQPDGRLGHRAVDGPHRPAARPGPGGSAQAERHQGDALQDRHRPRVRQRRLPGRAGESPGDGGLPGSAGRAGAAPEGGAPHGHRRGHGGGGGGLEYLHRGHGPALRARRWTTPRSPCAWTPRAT